MTLERLVAAGEEAGNKPDYQGDSHKDNADPRKPHQALHHEAGDGQDYPQD